jgi:5-methylcytosine-specific restriction endonuclease McrA
VDINPYSNYNKEYFEINHRVHDVKDFRKAVYIKHKYKCAACGEILDDNEKVELHHIIPAKDGGKYTLDNIVPLHRTCHESVTYAKKQDWFKHLTTKVKS